MSLSMPTSGVYRLATPQLPNGVHINGSNNDNVTFNTNIPSLDFAIRIRRVRWILGFSAWGPTGAANVDVQLFAQLTENQTKISVLLPDTSWLDEVWAHLLEVTVTAASVATYPLPMEIVHDFPDQLTPYSVATKLNLVTSSVSNQPGDATTVFRPVAEIEYTLERLTSDLRDYLSKRLQIQGS